MYGVERNSSATSFRSNLIPHSCAIAGRCSPAFVEPPLAATTRAAFSSASRVMMSRGRRLLSISFMTACPDAKAYSSRDWYGAGALAECGSAMPSASDTQAIVFAVNWPPQEPADGQATRSISARSSAFILPPWYCPTASKTSWTVTSRPRNRPGMIEPP